MTQAAIFRPFFVMMLLTLVVWIYMYARRIPFIQKNKLTAQQLTPLEFARLSPSAIATPSDNLKNLFELPVIFYALCGYLYVTNQVDGLYVVAAWLFVTLRVLHSMIHCTVNIVIVRFWVYFAASVALWFMVIRAALHLPSYSI